jgi:hypothetical protein
MDGTNISFIGQGPKRIPSFYLEKMGWIDISLPVELKAAREATKPSKYDTKFELEIANESGVVMLNYRFNGGEHTTAHVYNHCEDILGLEDLMLVSIEKVKRHIVAPSGIALLTQCASLSKGGALELFSGQNQTSKSMWGITLTESDNGFGGVATVERGNAS